MKLEYPLKRDKFITQKYGANPDFYKQYKIGGVPLKGHEGIDLRASTGTEVVACDDGFCQEAFDQGNVGYGKYIKLIHDWGESVYAHLSEFKIRQGTEVKKGQTIAKSGNTGNSTGPHLHFGMRINPYNRSDGWGGYSDPEPYLFGDTSTELDMPEWAKKLQPFFIEHNLQNGQIEGAVREWFGDSKIIKGFIEKWADTFELPEDAADLDHIEANIQSLREIEKDHVELVSAAEDVVGHFETQEGLRNALRVCKKELEDLAKANKKLTEEVEKLKKRRTLDRFNEAELFVEILNKLIDRLKGVIANVTKKS